jgi:hypothetical protein
MWSEEMDKKIRAAAESDAHGYDDKAWKGMELLLDKHLPQEKKRRRIIFFLLIGLLVAGIPAFYMIRKTSSSSGNNPLIENTTQGNSKNTKNNSQPGSSDQQQKPGTATNNTTNTTSSLPATETIIPATDDTKANTTITAAPATSLKSDPSMSIQVKNSGIGSTKPSTNNQNQPDKIKPRTQPAKQTITISNGPARSTTPGDPVTQVPPPVVTSPIVAAPVTNDATKTDAPKGDVAKNETATDETSEKETKTDSTTIAKTEAPAKKEKKKNSVAGKFIISASAGPDLSSVGTKTGKWRGQYGVGIGYAINDKWTIRTGFYVARKIYTADSTNYKTNFNTIGGGVPYPNIYKLDEIKANCLVYEIPVSIMYNFPRSKNHSWFISGGVSSYLMKSERYDCSYVNNSGQWQTHTYNFKNENSHLFSVINISGGYQYYFNNRLSLMAEPYLKIAAGGVGQGEVKLNSTGVLFTLGYKPFQKR